jgi:hypothetical protein
LILEILACLPAANAAIADRFFAALANISGIDTREVRPGVEKHRRSSFRQRYVARHYYKAISDVELLLSLGLEIKPRAIDILARSLFELAVEVQLIGAMNDSIKRIKVFDQAERLRLAREVVSFHSTYPDSKAPIHEYQDFVAKNEKRIEAMCASTWPDAASVTHWSLLDFAERVKRLKPPFDEIYRMSSQNIKWYVHSGTLEGSEFGDVDSASLSRMSFTAALVSYRQMLEAVIDEFKIADGARITNSIRSLEMASTATQG